jgi:hypothetical protein
VSEPVEKTLAVASYLLRNNLNPVLKPLLSRSLGRAVAAALVAVLLLPPLLSAAGVAAYGPPHPSVRKSLVPQGVSKELVLASTSAFLTAALLLTAVRGPHEVTASEEAEYEVLLSTPLAMHEYVLGKTLYFIAQSTIASLPMLVVGAALAPVLSGGSLAKAALFPAAYLLFLAYAEAFFQLVVVLRAAAGRHLGYLTCAAAAYAVAAAAHSIASRSLSPLLLAPALPAVRPLVHCFTISEPALQVAGELATLALAVALLLAALAAASSRLSPENVKPMSEVVRELQLGRKAGSSARIYASPSASIRKVVLGLSVLTARHLALVSLALVAAALSGLAARLLLPSLDTSTVAAFALGLLVVELSVSTGSVVLRDLSPLWLYRSLAADMKALTSTLLAKLLVYYTESFAVVAVLLAAATGRPGHLLLPVASLPAGSVFAVVNLWFLARVASRRRLVRYSSRGFYLIEDLVATLLMAFSLVVSTVAFTGFSVLMEYSGGGPLLGVLLAASVLASVPVLLFGREVVADTLSTVDVAG